MHVAGETKALIAGYAELVISSPAAVITIASTHSLEHKVILASTTTTSNTVLDARLSFH